MRDSQNTCPVCNSSDVTAFIEISRMPCHCNLLWPTRDEALNAPRGDIRLGFCGECGHIFNTLFDPALMKYTRDYENSLHFSPRFQKYAVSLASRLIETYDLRDKDIIEIGCGNGEFLTLLCESGSNRGTGFDRSLEGKPNLDKTAEKITFIRDFYSKKYARHNADLICCRQVLEHIHEPLDFLATIRRTIGNRLSIKVFFEVPNSLFILKDLSVWDIIYEHCSYFSRCSLKRAFLESGFSVRKTAEDFGGQFLSIEAFPSESRADLNRDKPEAPDIIAREIEAFPEKYAGRVKACQDRLGRIANKGQRAVIWGAGSKGVSLLNTLKVRDQIEYVVDINPRKQDMYIAGTGQRIVPPTFLTRYRPDFVLVMNPIYESEIKQNFAEIGFEPRILNV